MSKRLLASVIILGGLLLLALFVVFRNLTSSPPVETRSLIDTSFLASIPQKETTLVDTSRLAPGLVPPTNKWFSGFALQSEPHPGFAFPLSFKPTNTSFEINLPKVTSSPQTLFGAHHASLQALVGGASTYRVTRYDELSIDLTYKNKEGGNIGTLTTSAGSPYVFFETIASTTLTVPAKDVLLMRSSATFTVDQNSYYIAASDGVAFSQNDGHITINAPQHKLISFYALPGDQKADPLAKTALNKIAGVSVSYAQKGEESETTLTYKTKNNQPTTYGYLPHQLHATSKALLDYDSLYGKINVQAGNEFRFTTKIIPVKDSLDVSRISAADKQALSTTLRQDINATKFEATDTYFGGKNVYRAAQLLKLAKILGEESSAISIKDKLHRELSQWFSGRNGDKSFYYDTAAHGIVGTTPSFGSDVFNDHHFHYGYFIYAAAILSQYDVAFLTDNRAAIDLLVADIANYKTGEEIPLRRAFDPYFGHSWASGTSPFADGNNQESSSEALNAWVGTSLWAEATQNATLKNQATWMLSAEAASRTAYWTDFDHTRAPFNQDYAHSIVSLNWGGKRDYATFFSAEPSAVLGIQLIPMNPSMAYISSEGSRVHSNSEEAAPTSKSQFSDYILMYQQLEQGDIPLEQAEALDDSSIDGANSRAYLYAWILSHKK